MNGKNLTNFPLEVIEAAQRRYRDLYPSSPMGVHAPNYGQILEEELKKYWKQVAMNPHGTI